MPSVTSLSRRRLPTGVATANALAPLEVMVNPSGCLYAADLAGAAAAPELIPEFPTADSKLSGIAGA